MELLIRFLLILNTFFKQQRFKDDETEIGKK